MSGDPITDGLALRIDPPAFLAAPGLRAVLDALPEARVVGGAVRDALAGREVADIDLTTPAPPADVAARLTKAGIRAVPTGLAHGTITAVANGRGYEVTTLRRDVETDGRHAVVAFTSDWRADAARRDFTINAMSMTRDGAVFDYFGGVSDLQAGIIRFVGDPATRIAEDYLRVLRFFRFFARYALGPADPTALTAIRTWVSGLASLSAERVWSELTRILAAPDPRRAVALMDATGVLAAIIPEGTDRARLDRMVAAGAPIDPLLRVAALLTADPLAFASRLRLSAAERDRLVALQYVPVPDPASEDVVLRRLLADHDRAVLINSTWINGDGGAEWDELRRRLSRLERPVFPLEGHDVVALGIRPGPRVGLLLRQLRGWWLDGGCVADSCACREELARRIAA